MKKEREPISFHMARRVDIIVPRFVQRKVSEQQVSISTAVRK